MSADLDMREVLQRLARIEENTKRVPDLENRISAVERWQSKVVGMAAMGWAIVGAAFATLGRKITDTFLT